LSKAGSGGVNDLQIAVVTTLGTLLILVGAWLLLARRDASQNRAKFLGLEFELSTPALAVLLIGAGLLVSPAFVPHRPGGWPVLFTDATSSDDEGSPPGGSTILRQQTVVSTELEPNNRTGAANVVNYGNTISGELTPDDRIDYFIFNGPPDKTSKSRLIVRFLSSGSYNGYVRIWNNKEELLYEDTTVPRKTVSKVISASSSYLVSVGAKIYDRTPVMYEVRIAEEK
jgi:hypothetical protein